MKSYLSQHLPVQIVLWLYSFDVCATIPICLGHTPGLNVGYGSWYSVGMQPVNKGSIHPLLGGMVLEDEGPARNTAYLLEHDAGGV